MLKFLSLSSEEAIWSFRPHNFLLEFLDICIIPVAAYLTVSTSRKLPMCELLPFLLGQQIPQTQIINHILHILNFIL
jgi:hypothetical protein